jgi:2-C-methyl-D-erythritol 4-phosphate cytidylyltransferase
VAVALIVAAGRGERLGVGTPKALVHVGGRPMLEWSVAALRAVERVQEIVIALPAEHLGAAPQATVAVAGGKTRSESVLAALAASAADATGSDQPVIVHDAARIFATPQLFNDALDALARSGADAVVAAAPVTDTIKQTRGDAHGGAPELNVVATVDRSTLWSVQTPQVFRRGALEAALQSDPQLLARATDDAWLIEQAGGTVMVLPSPPANFKITTALDLRLAEMLLSSEL